MLGLFTRIRITYGITVCNEAAELEALLISLFPHIKAGDEIVVLRDVTNPSLEVGDVLLRYQSRAKKVVERKLHDNFSEFKNTLISEASGTHLFQIDADEILHPTLLRRLGGLLRRNFLFDCFAIPRINTVSGLVHQIWRNGGGRSMIAATLTILTIRSGYFALVRRFAGPTRFTRKSSVTSD